MPPFNEKLVEGQSKLRLFLYGAEKTKKTWWTAGAAQAGFNLIYLMCDDQGDIIFRMQPPEVQKRIYSIDIVDRFDVDNAANFMVPFLSGKEFIYNEIEKKLVVGASGINPEHGHYRMNANLLTPNDVLVIDSWTKLVKSLNLRYNRKNQIDITDPDANKDNWGGFRYAGETLDFFLNKLASLNCHVIVIGHSHVYEKYEGKGAKRELQWSKIVPVSSSGPHAFKIGAHFTDILYFYVRGSMYRIDSSGDQDRVGGARSIEPKVWDWDKLQFSDLIEKLHIPKPTNAPPPEAAKYYPPGMEVEFGKSSSAGNKPLIGGKIATNAEVSAKGPGGLLKLGK